MSEFVITSDDDTPPIMLAARAPGQVAAQPDNAGAIFRGAVSGNPNADVASGRFTAKGDGKAKGGDGGGGTAAKVVKQTQAQKANIPQSALDKRRDLVRRAAGLMEEMNMGEASKWLEQYGIDVTQARVDLWLNDVRSQRLDYMVDQMAPTLRSTLDSNPQDNVVVQVKAPKGWSSATLNSLTDAEFVELHRRLVGQGFDPEDVANTLVKNTANKKRKEQLEQLFGEPAPIPAPQPQGAAA
jgi:hypothetical protein